MLFGKRKKELELQQKELERKRIEEERLRREEQLRKEMEAEKIRAQEELAKIVPYKFSVPNPRPKELISVLTNMLRKLFPEAKKAYLVLTELDDKKGYLLVVDIDVKFLKIIHLYLDGETKKVRDGMPIECILYSKSGNLTEKMEPFYEKVVPESVKRAGRDDASINEIDDIKLPDILSGNSNDVSDE
ncbi:MAG: enhanced serine sensitivity protein SseB C-terminal domain-containing protein, partial [Clostridia bacterium]|nr:enhanced serine sensitivity protein SseB C-terminal domain-containing protein [Clostridia bacterium]